MLFSHRVALITIQVSPMGLATATISLCSLLSYVANEVFGDKASGLRDALVCVMRANSLPCKMKIALQSFLLRLESNCSTVKTHRPIVEQYKNLQDSINSYNANVMGLLDLIDKLEAEFNALTDAAAELQPQLDANTLRQQEIGTEQAD